MTDCGVVRQSGLLSGNDFNLQATCGTPVNYQYGYLPTSKVLFLSCLGLIIGNTSCHSISSQCELDIVWPSGLKLRMVYKEIARADKPWSLFVSLSSKVKKWNFTPQLRNENFSFEKASTIFERPRPESGIEKDKIWSEIKSGFEEPNGTSLRKNSKENSPLEMRKWIIHSVV